MNIEIYEPDRTPPTYPMEFVECPTCAAKPGAPILCPSCLQNRWVISQLEGKVQKLKKEIERFTQDINC